MSVWGICCRLLLVASLWQTPLPRIDYHSAAPQTAREFKHFAKFHTAAELRDCRLGWHLHFVWAQRPEAPAPTKVPGTDGTDRDGPPLCSVDSTLESSRQAEHNALPAFLAAQPAETLFSASLELQRHPARGARRSPPVAQDICTCLCTWQC